MAITTSWPDLLSGLIRGEDQPAEATGWAMGQILNGDATPAQLAAFVIALRSKGETVDELTGLADVMIEFATPIEIGGPAVDVVGSGGDRSNTVNISTMAAIVAAATGARVVKHGNRAASSASRPRSTRTSSSSTSARTSPRSSRRSVSAATARPSTSMPTPPPAPSPGRWAPSGC